MARICERRCLYGRGGILCRCNAMHFTGKRSLYGQDLVNSGKVKVAELDESPRSSRRALDAAGRLSGSQTSDRRITSSALPLLNTLDSNRVGQLLISLRRLAHRNGIFKKVFEKPGKYHEEILSSNPLYPAVTWAKLSGGQGKSGVRQTPRAKQNLQARSLGFPAISRISDFLRKGNPRNEGDTQLDGRDDTVSMGGSVGDGHPEASDHDDQMVSLQEALRRALGDR